MPVGLFRSDVDGCSRLRDGTPFGYALKVRRQTGISRFDKLPRKRAPGAENKKEDDAKSLKARSARDVIGAAIVVAGSRPARSARPS